MHDWPLVHLDDGFGGRWAVAQSTVGSFGVVVFPPFFDQDLCLAQAVEDFTIQELVLEAGIEASSTDLRERVGDGGRGDDCEDQAGVFYPREVDQADLPGAAGVAEHGA